MDVGTIFDAFGGLLQVFVPAGALPFVPVILIMVWALHQFTPAPKKLAPLVALALGLAVAFIILDMPWKMAIPCGLTLGGYAVAAWSGTKNVLELWKGQGGEQPVEITE